MANKTYTVTVASGNLYGGGTGNVFYLDGVRNATGPGTVDWVADSTLRFEQSDPSNNFHPLIFSTTTSKDQYLTSGVTYYLDGAVTYSQYTNTTTFNAATTRYVEVTPSSFTDFYYLCYVHGIGMGGIMDMVVNSWGAHSWNQGAWNQNQDLTVRVSNPNNVAWGQNVWGFGDWNNGEALSMSLNNSGITIESFVNVGWSSDTWGTETWGESGNLHAVTGLALTMSEGLSGSTINGNSDVIPSGNSLTVSAPATVEAFSAFSQTLTGLPMVAQLNFNPAFAQPSGFAMSAALGTAIGDNITKAEITSKLPGYWGYKSTWGTLAWGNGQTELLAMAMSENFSGADPQPDAEAFGQQMSMSLAAVTDTLGPNNFNIIGNATTGVGDTTMAWGDATWGNSRWNNGSFVADPNYGQTLAMSLGTASGELLTPVDVTGIALTAALSGPADVLVETKVFPPGNALTMGLGTGTNTLIWNAVDTGSAPTTPPGWKEVPTNAA